MLAAILTILGVAFIGTIGVGAIGSLIKNRNKGGASTPSSTKPEEKSKPEKKKKKERTHGQEEVHEEELGRGDRTGDPSRRIKRDDPPTEPVVKSEESKEPEEIVEPKKTKEDFIEIVDLARNQMIIDTEEY